MVNDQQGIPNKVVRHLTWWGLVAKQSSGKCLEISNRKSQVSAVPNITHLTIMVSDKMTEMRAAHQKKKVSVLMHSSETPIVALLLFQLASPVI